MKDDERMVDQIAHLCLSHFLCAFDPGSNKRKTREVVREVALRSYSAEMVDEFLDSGLERFQRLLVDEFNSRYLGKCPLRYQIVDPGGIGTWVQGYSSPKAAREVRFQNALHKLNPGEFEHLSAILLRLLGCKTVFFTPSSHDQGVDAFGYQDVVPPIPYGATHSLTWIVQAKHYHRLRVSSGDVRELIGSKELLVARVFSSVDQRYRELTLRPYAPTAVVLMTSEEIPATVRRLAEGAGVFVYAASDIFHVLSPRLGRNTASSIRELIVKESRSIVTLS
jgi:hypothetical protein